MSEFLKRNIRTLPHNCYPPQDYDIGGGSIWKCDCGEIYRSTGYVSGYVEWEKLSKRKIRKLGLDDKISR